MQDKRKQFFLAAFFALMFCLAGAKGTLAQTPPESTHAPAAAFKSGTLSLSEKSWDFGYIPKGSRVTHTFVIKNNGTDSLKNLKASPSCGCTAAPLDKTILAPGDSTYLEVSFNAKNYSGPVTKTVYLQSNDPQNPYFDLLFTANVGTAIPNLSVTPPEVTFDTLREIPNSPTKLEIKNINTDNKIGLEVIYAPKPFVDYKLTKKALKPGQAGEVSVRLKSDKMKPGEFFTSLTILCNDPNKSRFTVPIHGVYAANATK